MPTEMTDAELVDVLRKSCDLDRWWVIDILATRLAAANKRAETAEAACAEKHEAAVWFATNDPDTPMPDHLDGVLNSPFPGASILARLEAAEAVIRDVKGELPLISGVAPAGICAIIRDKCLKLMAAINDDNTEPSRAVRAAVLALGELLSADRYAYPLSKEDAAAALAAKS